MMKNIKLITSLIILSLIFFLCACRCIKPTAKEAKTVDTNHPESGEYLALLFKFWDPDNLTLIKKNFKSGSPGRSIENEDVISPDRLRLIFKDIDTFDIKYPLGKIGEEVYSPDGKISSFTKKVKSTSFVVEIPYVIQMDSLEVWEISNKKLRKLLLKTSIK